MGEVPYTEWPHLIATRWLRDSVFELGPPCIMFGPSVSLAAKKSDASGSGADLVDSVSNDETFDIHSGPGAVAFTLLSEEG